MRLIEFSQLTPAEGLLQDVAAPSNVGVGCVAAWGWFHLTGTGRWQKPPCEASVGSDMLGERVCSWSSAGGKFGTGVALPLFSAQLHLQHSPADQKPSSLFVFRFLLTQSQTWCFSPQWNDRPGINKTKIFLQKTLIFLKFLGSQVLCLSTSTPHLPKIQMWEML